jgi:subfamily B ATP-binding cassette protein MsbA
MEAGRITAVGTHEELLLNSPTYQRLYQLQFMAASEIAGFEAAMSARVGI